MSDNLHCFGCACAGFYNHDGSKQVLSSVSASTNVITLETSVPKMFTYAWVCHISALSLVVIL